MATGSQFLAFGVDFLPLGVFGHKKSMESIFGPMKVVFWPLRDNFRTIQVDFWRVEGEFLLWKSNFSRFFACGRPFFTSCIRSLDLWESSRALW